MTIATLPAGIVYDEGTLSYWVRADYLLHRVAGGWELLDMVGGELDCRFRTKAAGIAALSRLV
jgi:hypothetical protein